MDAETLSRVQFALTASFHFIFPPLSMGLGLMLVVMGVIYVRTKDPKWRQLSFFWVKVYGLSSRWASPPASSRSSSSA